MAREKYEPLLTDESIRAQLAKVYESVAYHQRELALLNEIATAQEKILALRDQLRIEEAQAES